MGRLLPLLRAITVSLNTIVVVIWVIYLALRLSHQPMNAREEKALDAADRYMLGEFVLALGWNAAYLACKAISEKEDER